MPDIGKEDPSMTRGSKIGIALLGTLIVMLTGYVIVQYFVIGADPHNGFVGSKVDDQGIAFSPWIYFLYVHIIFGTVALLAGPFQFSEKLRLKKRGLHRALGKVYVLSILISFLVGLYLAYYGSGGLMGVIGFYSLEIAWFATTFIGLRKILRREVQAHKEWMIRSYAVTLTFITFRILSVGALIIEGTPGVLFGATIVISWMLNLLIAEWLIVRARVRTKAARKSSIMVA
jgi:hypothetical protein